MLKNISQLEHIVSGKLYHFTCDADSPIPMVKEALMKMLQYIGQLEDQIAAGQKAEKEKAESESKAIIEEPQAG